VRAVCERTGARVAPFVAEHQLSLLSVAPELAADFAVPAELAASFAFSREGNLRDWTLRLAHGVTDFLLAVLAPTDGHAVTLRNVAQADPTDREFITVLRRRADPAMLEVHLDNAPGPDGDCLSAACTFLASGGALWGGAQAAGDDPVTTLLRASDLGMRMAYYDSALEWAERGRALIDPARVEDSGKLARNALFALLLLGRTPEAESLCDEMQRQEPDPALLAHVTYVMAILNARLYDPARHDYDAAKAWIERSMEFTDRLPPSEIRAVNRAFLMNTMALVEVRKSRHAAAFDLLDAGLRHMEEQAPTKYRVECGILLHNRARLHVAVQQPDQAAADLTALLSLEPSNSDAYFDRGRLHQRNGDHAAAVRDYGAALHWSPPYWQPHFNRAQAQAALGLYEAALGDYARVDVLDPGHVHSRAHAHCLRGLSAMEARDSATAEQEFSLAIEADPDLSDAWANRATIRFKHGDSEAALRDLDRALALRDDAEIFYNRGRVLESLSRWDAAIADYQHALALGATRPEQIRRRLAALTTAQNAHGQSAEPAV
jgi:tetratricopeptide (TPR) repeat protein